MLWYSGAGVVNGVKLSLTYGWGQFEWKGLLDFGQTVRVMADRFSLGAVFPSYPTVSGAFEGDESISAGAVAGVAGEGSTATLTEIVGPIAPSTIRMARVPWGAARCRIWSSKDLLATPYSPAAEVAAGRFNTLTFRPYAYSQCSVSHPEAVLPLRAAPERSSAPGSIDAVRLTANGSDDLNFTIQWEFDF
jgi:hypothetical protein